MPPATSQRGMRGFLALGTLAALFVSSPSLALDEQKPDLPIVDEGPIFQAVENFMAAIGDEDRTKLADHMIPEGMIFVHNLMDPANPRVDVVPVARHLENWALRDGNFEEIMRGYQLSVR